MVGDDLLVTNPIRNQQPFVVGARKALLCMVQIGSVTVSTEVVNMMGRIVMVSYRGTVPVEIQLWR